MSTHITEIDQIPAQGRVVLKAGSTWCGPCKKIGPFFESTAQRPEMASQCAFVSVDIDEAPEIAELYSIECIPFFIFLENQQVTSTLQSSDSNVLAQWIGTHLKTHP